MSGPSGGGQGGNRLIQSAGKWLAYVIAAVTAVFATPDLWTAWEPMIVQNIYTRYNGGLAETIYWGLRFAAYPLVFFTVSMTLGVVFVSLVLGIMLKLFGEHR